ncbi:unnamed protein product, partial [Prorocentrum cordatum]
SDPCTLPLRSARPWPLSLAATRPRSVDMASPGPSSLTARPHHTGRLHGRSPTLARAPRRCRFLLAPPHGRVRASRPPARPREVSLEFSSLNPYVQALCEHRREISAGQKELADEAVDSLEVRMATQRASALATLEVPAGAPRSAADGAEPGEPLCRRWPCDGAFDRGGQHTAVVSILAPEENEQCGCASTGSAAAAARPAGGAPARLL